MLNSQKENILHDYTNGMEIRFPKMVLHKSDGISESEGSPQASAIICASISPVILGGTGGVSRFLRAMVASSPLFA